MPMMYPPTRLAAKVPSGKMGRKLFMWTPSCQRRSAPAAAPTEIARTGLQIILSVFLLNHRERRRPCTIRRRFTDENAPSCDNEADNVGLARPQNLILSMEYIANNNSTRFATLPRSER